MKSSQILASMLFGSFAAAVPFKRALVTKTQVEVETVIVYTTVFEDDLPVAEATVTPGGDFYEQPATSVVAEPTSYAPAPVQEPSSVYTPPVQAPAPSSTVVVVSSSKPVETSAAPAPVAPTTTEAAYTPAPVTSAAPAPVATSAAPAPAPAPASAEDSASGSDSSSGSSSGSGEVHEGELTINPLKGDLGACGTVLNADDMVVALAKSAWGESTYNVQTGEATNPWCGKKINIHFNGKTVPATIMDLCPGCSGYDIDLSDAAWKAIGMTEWTRVQGSWSVAE